MDIKGAKCQNVNGKLSDEEFKKLIPHLEINQLLLIKVKKEGKWQNLFFSLRFNGELKKIRCTVCCQNVPLKKFKEHIRRKDHEDSLNQSENLFHPLYTENLCGESELNDTEKEERISKAKTVAAAIERTSCVVFMSSIKDLLNIEFQQKKDGNWQKMIDGKGPFTEKSKYTCRSCKRSCVGIKSLNEHLRGQSHSLHQHSAFAVRAPQKPFINKYSVLSYDVEKVHPSEKRPHIKPKKVLPGLDKKIEDGLIGVEYVVCIEKGDNERLFACCLCDPKHTLPTEELMESHLIGYKHRRSYCEMHFPDTTKHLEDRVKLIGIRNVTAGMDYIFSKMADGIEKYHGYGKPHKAVFDCYLRDMDYISELVHGLPHACQDFGPSFSNVVNTNELNAIKKNIDSNVLRSIEVSKARFTKCTQGKLYLNMRRHVSRVLQGSRNKKTLSSDCVNSVSPEKQLPKHDHSRRSHSNSCSVSRSISPHRQHSRKRRLSAVNKITDVWRIYRHRISESASHLEQAYLDYRQHPENHPSYDKEWSMFWKRRKSQLQEEGMDYRSHDFQFEWNTYFRHRLDQFFGEQLQSLKIDVRRQLNIPLDVEEDSRFFLSEHSPEPFIKRQSSERSEYVDEAAPWDLKRYQSPDQIWNPPAPMEHERPNIIGLLRLMTALDDHLGSIGEKILNLLTTALSLEKICSDDSTQLEQRILNASNCRLLKLAQEKLKSQLYAGLVERRKIESFNRVIESAEVLLNRANNLGWSNVEELSRTPTPSLEIEKLIEVLQEKTKNENPAYYKKSLSDTLLELVGQKNNNEEALGQMKLPSQIDHTHYESGNNSLPQSYNNSLTKQNTPFFPKSSYLSNTFRSDFGASKPILSDINTEGNNPDIWNRLGGQTNYPQHNFQDFENYGSSNSIGKNIYGGGDARRNSSFYRGDSNASINFTAHGANYVGGNYNTYSGANNSCGSRTMEQVPVPLSRYNNNNSYGSGSLGDGKYNAFGN